MNQPNGKPKTDQGWAWPQKTWLQQRLDIVRAREREMDQKRAESHHRAAAKDVKDSHKQDSE